MDERDLAESIKAAAWARGVHECCVPGCTDLKANASIYCDRHRPRSCPDCCAIPCECPHEWPDEVTP